MQWIFSGGSKWGGLLLGMWLGNLLAKNFTIDEFYLGFATAVSGAVGLYIGNKVDVEDAKTEEMRREIRKLDAILKVALEKQDVELVEKTRLLLKLIREDLEVMERGG